ncbi:MAG: hypothetical protein Q9187_009215, partial [Circinaria calcarea]
REHTPAGSRTPTRRIPQAPQAPVARVALQHQVQVQLPPQLQQLERKSLWQF